LSDISLGQTDDQTGQILFSVVVDRDGARQSQSGMVIGAGVSLQTFSLRRETVQMPAKMTLTFSCMDSWVVSHNPNLGFPASTVVASLLHYL
jgi:hypothetical protein